MSNKVTNAVVSAIISTVAIFLFTSSVSPPKLVKTEVFPFRKAGLTESQAAAHLIDRFTYGHLPGQVDKLVKLGLENWFQQQLKASLPDDELTKLLQGYDALTLTNTEVMQRFPKAAQIRRMAIKDGVLDRDSINPGGDKKAYKKQLAEYMSQKGIRPEQDLVRQFVNQKIMRASYSNNQLQEVMTEFWFNHFNVSFTKRDGSQFIPAYERDVIRPYALTNFESLLMATAKSPAMLIYLDNFSSVGTDTNTMQSKKNVDTKKPVRKMTGLNENYAREVMELHTLGVDGGYSQSDVTEAARVLTGWTVYPMSKQNSMKKKLDQIDARVLAKRGFVHEGDFLFIPNRHDNEAKTVLGKEFPAGGGYEEGVALLKLLAHHSSTAQLISKKIAVRFVSDNPPQRLIDKMARTFIDSQGDIRQVLLTMVSAPEFWSKEALRKKTKSPFELAISTVRALDAEIVQPYRLFSWITRMGQKMYYYQAPTGFPDKGQYWINTGSLLNRMNFGLAFASGRIPGVSFDLLALNKNHEPESAEAALNTYAKLMLPERNLNETLSRLTPLINDPELQQKVTNAADRTDGKKHESVTADKNETEALENDLTVDEKAMAKKHSEYSLSQVIGIIIGSPEFQRR